MRLGIRLMELRDLDFVTELAGQLGYPAFSAEVRVRFERLREEKFAALFVAEIDGVVVGWIQVNREMPSLVAKLRAEISALVVDEKFRGRRIGAKLLVTAENWARENDLDLVRLRSNLKREDAHRFYKREGYAVEKSWHLFVKKLGVSSESI